MVRSLDDLLADINAPLESAYQNGVFYRLAVLQPRDGRTFPMTRSDASEGVRISPNDNNGLNFYHRLLSPVEIKPLEGAKGKNSYQLAIYNMRLVGVGYRSNITDDDSWNNPDIARDVMAIIGANSVLSGKEVVSVIGQQETDKLTVLNTEYAGQTEFQHNTLRLIAFYIDYTIQQRQICFAGGVSPTNPLTSYTLLNKDQSIEEGNAIQEMISVPVGDVSLYVIDVNDTIIIGLTLNSSTGSITGTPTSGGSFDICALDSKNNIVGVQTATITLTGANPWKPSDITETMAWFDTRLDDGNFALDIDNITPSSDKAGKLINRIQAINPLDSRCTPQDFIGNQRFDNIKDSSNETTINARRAFVNSGFSGFNVLFNNIAPPYAFYFLGRINSGTTSIFFIDRTDINLAFFLNNSSSDWQILARANSPIDQLTINISDAVREQFIEETNIIKVQFESGNIIVQINQGELLDVTGTQSVNLSLNDTALLITNSLTSLGLPCYWQQMVFYEGVPTQDHDDRIHGWLASPVCGNIQGKLPVTNPYSGSNPPPML